MTSLVSLSVCMAMVFAFHCGNESQRAFSRRDIPTAGKYYLAAAIALTCSAWTVIAVILP